MKNYWTYVPFNEEELEELVEGEHDLPFAIWERLRKNLESVREHRAEMQAAKEAPAIPQVDWDRELDALLGDG